MRDVRLTSCVQYLALVIKIDDTKSQQKSSLIELDDKFAVINFVIRIGVLMIIKNCLS